MQKNKLVYGWGVNDYQGSCWLDNAPLPSYDIWKSMISRCYDAKVQIKQPTYIGCSVCEEWKYFSIFKIWYDSNHIEGFHLDKDILVKGNKMYSPDTCRFVPPHINTLLKEQCSRGNMPVGVAELKPNSNQRRVNIAYQAYCTNGCGIRISKTFKTIEEAKLWYSETKKKTVKERAIKAFLDNQIKTDIYLALIRRIF